jgi:UV excision repair protein RAD23
LCAHTGRVLNDSATVDGLNIKAGDVVVLMVKKAVQSLAPPAGTGATGVTGPAGVTFGGVAPVGQSEGDKPASQGAGGTPAADGTLVAALMAMNPEFKLEHVSLALQAAFNNPDRAVEYLFDQKLLAAALAVHGIHNPYAAPGKPDPDAANAAATRAGAGAGKETEPKEGGGLSPDTIARLQTMLTSHPRLLRLMLTRLTQADPQVGALLACSTPADLEQMLGAPPSSPPRRQPRPTPDQAPAAQGTADLTPTERIAVDNLTSLGFSRARALQAYIQAGRNELLAANLLFDPQ